MLWMAVGLVVVGVVVAVANLTHDNFFHGPALLASFATGEPKQPPGTVASAEASSSITLPEGKLRTAGIKVETAEVVELPIEIIVTGTIEPNPDRRVEIRPRVPGIVRAVNVEPSQKVKAGQVLALLDSAEIGSARLNVRARQLDLSIARTEAEWKSTIAANVETIIPELRKGTPAATLESQFASKPLGANRAELLSAYADLEIATHEQNKQASLRRESIVGEHPWFVALHTREASQAKFEAALEQVRFDAAQQKRLADQQVRRAEAELIIAVQRLRILGVQEGPTNPLAQTEDISLEALAKEDVTAYPLTAPFDGTIITRAAVFSQRAEPADVLFTLADISTVRVVANIAESQFTVLPALQNGTVHLSAQAYPGKTFEAKVLYTTQQVDPNTRHLRLVAESSNTDELLRLGMFVQVRLDCPSTERVLTVPAAALVEFDGRPAVFVPGRDGRTFTLKPVETGREVADRQVITAGLKPGDQVVTTGAFVLKSELILQNTPEED
jgi:membrane fusion protein, heavy metal efflux system